MVNSKDIFPPLSISFTIYSVSTLVAESKELSLVNCFTYRLNTLVAIYKTSFQIQDFSTIEFHHSNGYCIL